MELELELAQDLTLVLMIFFTFLELGDKASLACCSWIWMSFCPVSA